MSLEAAMSSLRLQTKLGGTIKPNESFDSEAEAAVLRKAMKGATPLHAMQHRTPRPDVRLCTSILTWIFCIPDEQIGRHGHR